ncbi:MAG TPA: protein-disulfide reductase DsbD domain-containing protein [Bryobacteraceae bacterium]|nr:protein-disulfide reductase DsbD domain-containing protein [Bryobacteraceae bacterium]
MTVGVLPKVVGKRNAAVQAKIPCTVREGFHVNSDKPAEDYLIPLKITWTQTGALQPQPATFPAPQFQKYEFSQKPLSVFTGAFDVTANFKVAANAPAGQGIATGRLSYQACNNTACFAPKSIQISIPYRIE